MGKASLCTSVDLVPIRHLKTKPNRYHYTQVADLNPLRTYSNHIWHKPYGLWYSIGQAWLLYCKYHGESIPPNRFELFLHNTDDILILESFDDIVTFTDKYYSTKIDNINWDIVKHTYPALEIHNYDIILEQQRTELTFNQRYYWYMLWSCSSGCIWNLRCVRNWVKVYLIQSQS